MILPAKIRKFWYRTCAASSLLGIRAGRDHLFGTFEAGIVNTVVDSL